MGLPATRKTSTEEDRGENNKDPDWLMEQMHCETSCMAVLHCATRKNSIKSLLHRCEKFNQVLLYAALAATKISCETGLAILGATCVATKRRDKLHEKSPSVTG